MSVASKARALVSAEQAASHVLIFSKVSCPFCSMVKSVFAKHKVKPACIELDQIPNGAELQQKLAAITGQRTVPNVFIGDKHIGGCDDTKTLDSQGKLAALLKES